MMLYQNLLKKLADLCITGLKHPSQAQLFLVYSQQWLALPLNHQVFQTYVTSFEQSRVYSWLWIFLSINRINPCCSKPTNYIGGGYTFKPNIWKQVNEVCFWQFRTTLNKPFVNNNSHFRLSGPKHVTSSGCSWSVT